MENAAPEPRAVAPQRLLGVAFIMLGLGGDGVAGYLILAQLLVPALAVHVLAVGVWGLGMQRLTQPAAPEPATGATRNAAHGPSGWAVAGTIISGCTFPAIGMFSVSVAFLFSHVLRRRTIPRSTLGETLASLQVPAFSMRPAGLEQASQVLTIADVLHQQNTEMRRAVVRTLGFQGDKESVVILRRLLTDGNPDVRSDAAVILTRLENDYQQRILKAQELIEAAPDDDEQLLQLGRRYQEFAESGLLDPISREHYLHEAEYIFARVTEMQPKRLGLFIELARIYHQVGRSEEAIAILTYVLRQRREDTVAFTLLLEVAFAQQAWSVFLQLAQQAPALAKEQRELLRWWAEIIPPTWKGGAHG
jgi:hypothetical protein